LGGPKWAEKELHLAKTTRETAQGGSGAGAKERWSRISKRGERRTQRIGENQKETNKRRKKERVKTGKNGALAGSCFQKRKDTD